MDSNNFINRDVYLKMLINRRDNGEVKIITGPRRSGKSWLLKKIYKSYLIGNGVPNENIISISFDIDDDTKQSDLRNPNTLKTYLYSKIISETEKYYVFLDEIQEVEGFERIVNGLNAHDNVDVYITGSNSKFLSSDINTIFRGRGDEIRVFPLSFKEFRIGRNESINELWKEFYTYGGMPALRNHHTPEQKVAYLQRLWKKTYLSDVVDRYHIKNVQALEALVDSLCSAVGSLTNPLRIQNSLESVQKVKLGNDTVVKYIDYLEDAFLFEGAKRYNIKGRKYYESLKKYYSLDVGLRNARLNFRQQEVTHIMENVIYNELRIRGYLVDVGVVESRVSHNGKSEYVLQEVDFIATNGVEKYYIQSAFSLPDEDKLNQELASLRKIDDSFKKIVIVGDDIATYTNDEGIVFIGLFQFLENEDIVS